MFCDSPRHLAPMCRGLFCLRKASFSFSEDSAALGCAHWGGAERGCREDELFLPGVEWGWREAGFPQRGTRGWGGR